ncbi:hypothetical protein GQ457_16G021380 [Hibiscus cannabinus]
MYMLNGDDEYEAYPNATNFTPPLGTIANVTLQKKSYVLESTLAPTMAQEHVLDDHAIKALLRRCSDPSLKLRTWDLLNRLSSFSSLPWLIRGDLNEILSNDEKQGVTIILLWTLLESSDLLYGVHKETFHFENCRAKDHESVSYVHSGLRKKKEESHQGLIFSGQWHESIQDIMSMVTDYFHNIFALTNSMIDRPTPHDNIMDIGPKKNHGVDSLSSNFFHQHRILSDQICYGPQANHLLYDDNNMIFLQNTIDEASRLKDVLLSYVPFSCQRVNFDKSTAFCSPHTSLDRKQVVCKILGIREIDDHGIYLDIPLLVGKNKTNALGCVRDKYSIIFGLLPQAYF